MDLGPFGALLELRLTTDEWVYYTATFHLKHDNPPQRVLTNVEKYRMRDKRAMFFAGKVRHKWKKKRVRKRKMTNKEKHAYWEKREAAEAAEKAAAQAAAQTATVQPTILTLQPKPSPDTNTAAAMNAVFSDSSEGSITSGVDKLLQRIKYKCQQL